MKKLLVLAAIVHVTLCFCFGQTEVESKVKAHISAADQHAMERRHVEAAAEITKAIAIDPQNAILFLIRAVYTMRPNSGDTSFYKDAETALALAPDNEDIVFRVIAVIEKFGDPDLCRKVLGAADALVLKHSQSVTAYSTRIRARTCVGDLIGAYNDMGMVEKLNPENRAIQSQKADLISKIGDSAEAVRLVQTAIEDLQKKLAEAKTDGEKADARQQLMFMLRARASLAENRGDQTAMIADLTRAIELVPGVLAYIARARAYQRMKRFPDAIADINRVMAIHPPEASKSLRYSNLMIRSEIYTDAGKYDEALTDLEECLRLYPATRVEIEKRMQQVKQKKLT